MQKTSLRLAALGCISVLTACTGGQAGVLPTYTSVNVPATTKLQFAVGTANYAGTVGLNTVTTFRQANGLSATQLNTPSIVGPAGFVVPAVASAGTDAGTGSITATLQTLPGNVAVATTFGQSGGVFGYGFAPLNSTTGGSQIVGVTTAGYYREPFYSATQMRPILGPPATPTFTDGNTVGGFVGYPSGFASFAGVTLAPGTYTLSVLVPSSDPKQVSTLTAAAALTSTAPLGTYPAPVFTSDGLGGGTIAIAPPPGVTETIVYVRDTTAGLYYSIFVPGGTAKTVQLPDKLGPTTLTSGATPTLAAGDTINVVAIGFDYGAFEAAPPGNLSQSPSITGANGQADLTASAITVGAE